MTSRADSADPRAERVRAQILEAALTLASTRRIEEISIPDIAAAAGVSRQSFYRHFTDRDSAIAAAITSSFRTWLDAANSGDPRARLRTLMDYAAEHGQLHRNVYPSAASQLASAAFRAELEPIAAELARRLLTTRHSIGQLDALGVLLSGGLMETVTRWTEGRGTDTPDETSATLLGALSAMLAENP
ncbi:TetR/AcrR family transcriptional regulator [Paractinoplanes lichenicola]|uniref:TetR/AcrR family transcriptional regulator n=1 Tax=Paractinoplanes lichenicola TaxID=2802976 RepID=A0ABS1VQY2_9ACTN|nr:TetR/AcrR family transcriptional regulator [Actinoplanes lichenicola]MBL7255961.1 TetR/AcrR family transcriptional regulator [Actinoplanes lichenicola]